MLTGSYWHMIIGGSNGTLLDTVEMLNWKTGEQCYLKSKMPLTVSEHSGAVLDGVPVFCGGYGPSNTRQKGCYKFDKVAKNWQNVSWKWFKVSHWYWSAFHKVKLPICRSIAHATVLSLILSDSLPTRYDP